MRSGVVRGAARSDQQRDTLRNSFWGALSWAVVSKVFTQVLAFGRSVLLARLLAPEDYGLWGMASLVLSGIFAMTHFNLGAAAVARRFDNEVEFRGYLNTIWTADLVRRAAISLLLALLAWPMAMYFGDRRLIPMLLIISTSPLVLGFENIGMWCLHKDMQFRPIVIQQQGAEVATTVLAVVAAYLTRDYKALVTSQWAQTLCIVGLSYLVCDYRPRLEIDRTALRQSFGFGKHMLVIGLLGYLTTQFDNMVVGRYLGAAVLGAYILAYRLATLPGEFLNSVFAMALFPLYAKVSHERPEKLMHTFYILATAGAALLIAILLPLQLAARPVIQLIYGSKWDAAFPFLSVLVFVGLFRGLTETIGPFLRAVGRPDLDARGRIVEVVIFVPMTLWLVPRQGGLGAAWAGVFASALAYGVRFLLALRLSDSGKLHTAAILSQPLIAAVVAYGICLELETLRMPSVAVAFCFNAIFLPAVLFLNAGLRQELTLLARRIRS